MKIETKVTYDQIILALAIIILMGWGLYITWPM